MAGPQNNKMQLNKKQNIEINTQKVDEAFAPDLVMSNKIYGSNQENIQSTKTDNQVLIDNETETITIHTNVNDSLKSNSEGERINPEEFEQPHRTVTQTGTKTYSDSIKTDKEYVSKLQENKAKKLEKNTTAIKKDVYSKPNELSEAELKKQMKAGMDLRNFVEEFGTYFEKDTDSASPLFAAVKDSFYALQKQMSEKTYNVARESSYIDELSQLYRSIALYYDKNSGTKWSSKGRRRRNATERMLNKMESILKNGPRYMQNAFFNSMDYDEKEVKEVRENKDKVAELSCTGRLYKEIMKDRLNENDENYWSEKEWIEKSGSSVVIGYCNDLVKKEVDSSKKALKEEFLNKFAYNPEDWMNREKELDVLFGDLRKNTDGSYSDPTCAEKIRMIIGLKSEKKVLNESEEDFVKRSVINREQLTKNELQRREKTSVDLYKFVNELSSLLDNISDDTGTLKNVKTSLTNLVKKIEGQDFNLAKESAYVDEFRDVYTQISLYLEENKAKKESEVDMTSAYLKHMSWRFSDMLVEAPIFLQKAFVLSLENGMDETDEVCEMKNKVRNTEETKEMYVNIMDRLATDSESGIAENLSSHVKSNMLKKKYNADTLRAHFIARDDNQTLIWGKELYQKGTSKPEVGNMARDYQYLIGRLRKNTDGTYNDPELLKSVKAGIKAYDEGDQKTFNEYYQNVIIKDFMKYRIDRDELSSDKLSDNLYRNHVKAMALAELQNFFDPRAKIEMITNAYYSLSEENRVLLSKKEEAFGNLPVVFGHPLLTMNGVNASGKYNNQEGRVVDIKNEKEVSDQVMKLNILSESYDFRDFNHDDLSEEEYERANQIYNKTGKLFFDMTMDDGTKAYISYKKNDYVDLIRYNLINSRISESLLDEVNKVSSSDDQNLLKDFADKYVKEQKTQVFDTLKDTSTHKELLAGFVNSNKEYYNRVEVTYRYINDKVALYLANIKNGKLPTPKDGILPDYKKLSQAVVKQFVNNPELVNLSTEDLMKEISKTAKNLPVENMTETKKEVEKEVKKEIKGEAKEGVKEGEKEEIEKETTEETTEEAKEEVKEEIKEVKKSPINKESRIQWSQPKAEEYKKIKEVVGDKITEQKVDNSALAVLKQTIDDSGIEFDKSLGEDSIASLNKLIREKPTYEKDKYIAEASIYHSVLAKKRIMNRNTKQMNEFIETKGATSGAAERFMRTYFNFLGASEEKDVVEAEEQLLDALEKEDVGMMKKIDESILQNYLKMSVNVSDYLNDKTDLLNLTNLRRMAIMGTIFLKDSGPFGELDPELVKIASAKNQIIDSIASFAQDRLTGIGYDSTNVVPAPGVEAVYPITAVSRIIQINEAVQVYNGLREKMKNNSSQWKKYGKYFEQAEFTSATTFKLQKVEKKA